MVYCLLPPPLKFFSGTKPEVCPGKYNFLISFSISTIVSVALFLLSSDLHLGFIEGPGLTVK